MDGVKTLLAALLGFAGVTLVLVTPSTFSFLTLSDIFAATEDEAQRTFWVGVVMHGLDLLHIVVAFFLPVAGAALKFVAGPLYLAWFPLLARDFFRLEKGKTQ